MSVIHGILMWFPIWVLSHCVTAVSSALTTSRRMCCADMGTIGQRCLTYHVLDIGVWPEVRQDTIDHQRQDRRRGHPP